MEMAGERRIAAAPQRVWEALNDPAVLRACIPGCQSLEKEADDRFTAVAEVKIGPIGARFKGAVALSELDPPHGYTISGQGSGGVAGNARGTAKVRLSADGPGTLLAYTVDAQVGGRMAQLGGPLIDATAKNLAEKFFTKFGETVGGEVAAATPGRGGTRDSRNRAGGDMPPLPPWRNPRRAAASPGPGRWRWGWRLSLDSCSGAARRRTGG